MGILDNIQSLCKARGVSLPNLEKELGFGKGAMYKWDVSSPAVEKVEKVSEYFNVSLDRIVRGFDANEFSNLTNLAKGNRTIIEFSNETGVDHNELIKICLGLNYEKPSIETVKKISSSNQQDWLFDEDRFLEAAGYLSNRQGDLARERIFKELIEQYEEAGFSVGVEKIDYAETIFININQDGLTETVGYLQMPDFLENGFDLLEELKSKYDKNEPEQFAIDTLEVLNDPQLGLFFKDFLGAPEDRREEMIRIWQVVREAEKGRKPGDKQGKLNSDN